MALCALSMLWLLRGPLVAQERVEVPSESSCGTCRIHLDRIAVLGRPTDPFSLDRFSRLARSADGRFFVAPTANPGEVFVYTADGGFSESVGRRGEGPEEFRSITHLTISGDTALDVFDAGNARVVQLDIRSDPIRIVDSRPLRTGRVYGAGRRGDGKLLVQATVPGASAFYLHLIGSSGEVERSFVPRDRRLPDFRPLTVARDDRIWLAHLNRYEVELWDAAGNHLRTLTREPAWFRPWDELRPSLPHQSPPGPATVSVTEDEEARLWVVVGVADANWRPGVGAPAAGAGLPAFGTAHLNFDSMIEVLDTRSNRVIARGRSDRHPLRALPGGFLYHLTADASGRPYIEVFRPRISAH